MIDHIATFQLYLDYSDKKRQNPKEIEQREASYNATPFIRKSFTERDLISPERPKHSSEIRGPERLRLNSVATCHSLFIRLVKASVKKVKLIRQDQKHFLRVFKEEVDV